MASESGKESYPEPGWSVVGWFYEQGNRRRGPFSQDELRRKVAAMEIPPGTKVYVGWSNGADVQFSETDLRLALGTPGTAPPFKPEADQSPSNTAPAEEQATSPRCPRCRRPELRRSRVRWYDLPAVVLFFRPFRCARCGRRFYRFP